MGIQGQAGVSDEQVKGMPEESDDFRPNRESLSNAEVRATGLLCQGAVLNIARELIASRGRIARSEQALAALQATLDTTIQESLKEITEVRARYEQMEQERDALKGALEESRRVLVIDNEYAADSNSVLAIDAALRGLASNRIVAAPAASQQQVAALEARNKELESALRGFCDKIDEVEPHINNAFIFMAIHGGKYTGPNYAGEYKAARAALKGAS